MHKRFSLVSIILALRHLSQSDTGFPNTHALQTKRKVEHKNGKDYSLGSEKREREGKKIEAPGYKEKNIMKKIYFNIY
jgi:hypothetical protein